MSRIRPTNPDRVIMYHPKHGYWQCGMWVGSKTDATKYRDTTEAGKVKLLRGLPNDTEIITL